MLDFFGRLFDTSGFAVRQDGGGWTDGLVWLHVGSDLFFWLACVLTAIVLLNVVRRRPDLPSARVVGLFAGLFLACGCLHFVQALTFDAPVFRSWKDSSGCVCRC